MTLHGATTTCVTARHIEPYWPTSARRLMLPGTSPLRQPDPALPAPAALSANRMRTHAHMLRAMLRDPGAIYEHRILVPRCAIQSP
jgi:hypothetical protein